MKKKARRRQRRVVNKKKRVSKEKFGRKGVGCFFFKKKGSLEGELSIGKHGCFKLICISCDRNPEEVPYHLRIHFGCVSNK